MAASDQKRPWWKWLLLMMGAFMLATFGYGLIAIGHEAARYLHAPGLTVVGTALVLGIYALMRGFRKEWPAELRLRALVPHTLLGLLVGAVYMTLVVGTMDAMDCASLSWQGFSWPQQWRAIMLFLGVAVGEEIIFRGVLFRMIDERWNTTVALTVSALLFGLMHLPNEGATWWSSLAIAIEAGLMLAAAYKWSGTLWVPIGIHWAWNYVQGNIYGLAVSGTDAGESVLATTTAGPDIITGGPFGAEASIIAVIYGIIITAAFLTNRYRPVRISRQAPYSKQP